jgi:predicted Zn-dependent protease
MGRGTLQGSVVIARSDNYGATSWDGLAIVGYVPNYSFGEVRLNRHYIDSYSSPVISGLATHEFGHILGLADRSTNNPATVMYYATPGRSYRTPQTYDINNLNTLYP